MLFRPDTEQDIYIFIKDPGAGEDSWMGFGLKNLFSFRRYLLCQEEYLRRQNFFSPQEENIIWVFKVSQCTFCGGIFSDKFFCQKRTPPKKRECCLSPPFWATCTSRREEILPQGGRRFYLKKGGDFTSRSDWFLPQGGRRVQPCPRLTAAPGKPAALLEICIRFQISLFSAKFWFC